MVIISTVTIIKGNYNKISFRSLTLQVPGLLDARALVEETLEMAGQDAVVVQNLFHVELIEPLHVGREILDLFVGGCGGGCGRTGGTGVRGVHGHAAQSDQDLAVHCGYGAGVVAGDLCRRRGGVCCCCVSGRVWRTSVDGHSGPAGFI